MKSSTVVHGRDIKKLSLPYGFWKIIILAGDLLSESQFHQRKDQKLKRKTSGKQQQANCGGHQTDARFVCISNAKLGLGKKGSQQ